MRREERIKKRGEDKKRAERIKKRGEDYRIRKESRG